MHIHLRFVPVLLVAVLAACGGGDGDGNTPIRGNSSGGGLLVLPGQVGEEPSENVLAGTVQAPSSGNVAGSVLRYCPLVGGRCGQLQEIPLTGSGSTARFRTPVLAAGSYIVAAGKDNNNDGDLSDPTDWFGCANNCEPITPPQTSLFIQMRVGGGSSSALGAQHRHPEIEPGEVIVKFRPGVSLQQVGSLRVEVGGQPVEVQRVRSLGLPQTELLRASLDVPATLELIAQLNVRPDVLYAEPNYIYRAFKTPNDPLYNRQWHYQAMNLPAAWDITDGTSGSPVTVAVVDTGSIPHPDLNAAQVGGYDFISSPTRAGDRDGRDPNPNDEGGESGYHGAHVAGTIAARSNNGLGVAGVSWGARIVHARVLGVDGSGSGTDILDGVRWAAGLSVSGVPANPNPAKVINLSLGGPRPCSVTEQALFSQLKNAGVIVVVAAGNEDDDAAGYAPASCDDVITVGATGPRGERARYSNYGAPIDVMAPGGDTQQTITVGGQRFDAGVLSTVLAPDQNRVLRAAYTTYNGTSMAAPHISGLVALMLSRDPSLSFDTVLARLRSASTPLSSSLCNSPVPNGCGAGLVDAARALSATGGGGGTPAPPPPPPPTGTAKIYVAALYCSKPDCSTFDQRRSNAEEVSGPTQNIAFVIGNLVGGTFIFAGWQDLNGDQVINGNDGFGFTDPVVLRDNQNRNDILVRLRPYATYASAAALNRQQALEQALEEAVR